MALKLIQQVKYCPYCNKSTACNCNTKEMSWLMHLVLAIFTCGIWILFWLLIRFFHGLKKSVTKEQWLCSECEYDINNSNILKYKNSKIKALNTDLKTIY